MTSNPPSVNHCITCIGAQASGPLWSASLWPALWTAGYFEGTRYLLHAWTIMPNHVHVLFTMATGFTLSSILYSWKSFTSKQANKLLKTSGRFWQPEYFDRLIKTERQFEFTLRHILNNPVEAGLCQQYQEWLWSGCSSDMMRLVDRFFGYKEDNAGKMPRSIMRTRSPRSVICVTFPLGGFAQVAKPGKTTNQDLAPTGAGSAASHP